MIRMPMKQEAPRECKTPLILTLASVEQDGEDHIKYHIENN